MASKNEENEVDLIAPELMARVSQIQVRTRRLVNDVLAGAYRSTFRGSGVEFEEVRPYQPGDDVRSIDWNRTAHSGETFVKTYVEERELTLMFLVDSSRSMDFGSRELTKREVAAQFCALLAFVAQRQQDRVGLCLFGEEPGLHLPPRKGAGSVARVVREVIAAPASAGGADVEAVLELQARTLRRKSLLFLLTDFLGDPTTFSDALTRVGRRHEVIAVRVVDPFEEELPAAGRIRLADVESGAEVEVDTRSARVREAWAQDARERREALSETLLRSRVDLIELYTNQSIAEPVSRFFNQRRRRQGAPGVISAALTLLLGLGATVRAEPAVVEVGEPIRLEISVEHGDQERIEFLEEHLGEGWVLLESAGPVRMPASGDRPATTRVRWTVCALEPSEPGEAGLPTVLASVGGTSPEALELDGAGVQVVGVLLPDEDAARPPLGFRDAHEQTRGTPWWVPAGIGALVSALVGWLLVRRRKPLAVQTPAATPLERLATIEASRLEEPEEVQEAYYVMTAALREGIDQRLERDLRGRTDEEWLAGTRLPPAEQEMVAALLRESAEVKYGTARPTHWGIEEMLERVRSVLESQVPGSVSAGASGRVEA